jgi:hypothetical protein
LSAFFEIPNNDYGQGGKMFQFIIRLLLVVACSVSGYFIALEYYDFPFSLVGFVIGFLIAIFVIQIEQTVRKVSLRIILGGVVGIIIGFLIAFLIVSGLRIIPNWEKQEMVPWEYVYIILMFVLGYLGLFL